MVLVVFMSCSIVMLTDNEQTILPSLLSQAFSPPLAGLAARPPAPAPGLLPKHHLPLAGACLGCPVPASRPRRRYQSGPQPGPFRRQLLLPPTLFSFPRPQPRALNPTLASEPRAFVPSLPRAGQRSSRCAGRWPQATQGGSQNAGRQKPSPRVPLQCQGVLHHGPFLASRRLVGPSSRHLLGRSSGGPHPRRRGLERPRPAHPAG